MLPFPEPLPGIKLIKELKLFNHSNIGNAVVDIALNYLGYPASSYRGPLKGIDPEKGFDCSGFALHVLNEVKKLYPSLDIPDGVRHANEMFDRLGVSVDESVAKPGDLIFFTRKGFSITHVGFYCGFDDNGTKYIVHSPGVDWRKVKLSKFSTEFLPIIDPYQIYRTNPVGIKRLTVVLNNEESGRWKQFPIK